MWSIIFRLCLIFIATMCFRKGTMELIDMIQYPDQDMKFHATKGIIFKKKVQNEILRVMRHSDMVRIPKDVQDAKDFIFVLFVECVCEMCDAQNTSIEISKKFKDKVDVVMRFDEVGCRVANIKFGDSREFHIDYTYKDIHAITTEYAIRKMKERMK